MVVLNVVGWKHMLEHCFDFNFVYVACIAFLIFCVIFVLAGKKKQRQERAFSVKKLIYMGVLSIYIALLLGGMIFNRDVAAEHKAMLLPFWSYRACFLKKDPYLLGQMIYNVVLFSPWPILFYGVFSEMKLFRWSVGTAFMFSVFIEVTQLVFKLGLFEFDDIFHNVLGAVLGFGILTITTNKNIHIRIKNVRSPIL